MDINAELKQMEADYFEAVQQLLVLADKVGLDLFAAACEEAIEIKKVEREQGKERGVK